MELLADEIVAAILVRTGESLDWFLRFATLSKAAFLQAMLAVKSAPRMCLRVTKQVPKGISALVEQSRFTNLYVNIDLRQASEDLQCDQLVAWIFQTDQGTMQELELRVESGGQAELQGGDSVELGRMAHAFLRARSLQSVILRTDRGPSYGTDSLLETMLRMTPNLKKLLIRGQSRPYNLRSETLEWLAMMPLGSEIPVSSISETEVRINCPLLQDFAYLDLLDPRTRINFTFDGCNILSSLDIEAYHFRIID